MRDQVRQLDRLEVDPTLAHQRHDDGAAHQVVARQRQAAHDREAALAQRVVVLGQGLRVLAVGGAHAADRRHTQADQVAVGLRAVALEVAVQPALALGHGQRVVGSAKWSMPM